MPNKLASIWTYCYDKSNVHCIDPLRNSQVKLYTTKELNWINENISILGIDMCHESMTLTNYEKLIDKSSENC